MISAPALYAEDAPDDAFFMRRAWECARVSHPLIIVRDGQQAIDYLSACGPFSDRQRYPLPCLLLLDLKLPVRSGFEVLEWIRRQPSLRKLKVVIVSGSNQDSDLALARSFQIVDYLVKPSSPLELVKIVRQRKGLWLPPGLEPDRPRE